MKFSAMFCLVLLLGICHANSGNNGGSQGNQAADSPKNISSAYSSGQSSPNSPDKNTSRDAGKNQDNEVKVTALPEKIDTHIVKDPVDVTLLICTGILTVVGIVGTCAAIKTLRAIRIQAHYMGVHARHFDSLAKAASDNAQAAKTSSGALVASEQAWITVNLEFTQLLGNVGENTQKDKTVVYVNCVCKNYGKTPAWIEEICCKLDIPKWFDEHPDFAGMEPYSSEPEMIGPGDESKPRQLSPECNGHSTLDNVVAIYGIVKYRDMFGVNRTSTFGYSVIDIRGEFATA